jgi:ABC-type polysaccharide/polyol phosphate export permease
MTFVFKDILQNPTPNFSAYVLAAYLPFMFLQFSLMDSAQSVLAALPFVKKVYFPREILPLAAIISNFIHFLLALIVFFAYMLIVYAMDSRVFPFTYRLLALPLMIGLSFCLATGLGLIVSALNTFYEDVKYLVGIAMYLLFFLSPIMYFSENVKFTPKLQEMGTWVYTAYHLNPIALLSTAYKKTLVRPGPIIIGQNEYKALPLDWLLFSVCAAVCVGTLIFGYWLFNRLKWKFVERP